MNIVQPYALPPAITVLRETYSRLPIPIGILDSALQCVWQNNAMRTSCPTVCQKDGIQHLAMGIPLRDIMEEITETGSFQVPFHAANIFTSRGLVIGAVAGTGYFFIQASVIADTGTGMRPEGLEKTLCRFEEPIRRNLQPLFTLSQELPGLDGIRLAAKAIQRTVATTMDFIRLRNGIYPRRKIRVSLYPFLQKVMEVIEELIGSGVSLQYHIPYRGTPVYTVTDTLLLTEIFGLLFSLAVESAQSDGGICVEAIASQMELQTFISITNNQSGPAFFRISPGYQKELAETAAIFLGGSLSLIVGEQKSVCRLTLPVCDDNALEITPEDAELPLYPDIKSYLEIFLGGNEIFVQHPVGPEQILLPNNGHSVNLMREHYVD